MWKEIAPDYLIDTCGQVMSLKYKTPRLLKPRVGARGYLNVRLCLDDEVKNFQVHRLVAEVFIPDPLNLREVNHKNGIKTDNRVENLEWVTHAENIQHACDNKLINRAQGEDVYNAKLTAEQVIYIRSNPDGLTCKALAKKFGVDPTVISNVQLGKSYRDVDGQIRGKMQSGSPRVSDDICAEIKRLYVKGSREFGSVALGKMFGINHSSVLKIIRR